MQLDFIRDKQYRGTEPMENLDMELVKHELLRTLTRAGRMQAVTTGFKLNLRSQIL